MKLSLSSRNRCGGEIDVGTNDYSPPQSFSALQRAEIAEMIRRGARWCNNAQSFSALQRAEIAEIPLSMVILAWLLSFSALQRAEIAEMWRG